MSDELTSAPAVEIARRVRSGEVKAVEVVRSSLERIAALDPELGAFQLVRSERALAEAEELGKRADLPDLPLAGVPVAVKDNTAVAGEPKRNGSRATTDVPSPRDDEVVRRLRAGGAVVVGLTRPSELGTWGTSESLLGTTRNPWGPARTAGGSSGGAGAAVAAGMVPLAHGADGLGSIRIPAAACGVVGVKPGPGMVPVDPDWWFGMVEHGPLATTVGDTALMLSVMAERPELEPTPPDRPLRIAVSTKFPRLPFPVDPEYRRATMETAERLAAAGHVVEEADPPYSQSMANGAYLRWFAGTAHTAEGLDVQRLEPRTRAHVRAGRLLGRMVKPTQQYRWRELAARFFASRDLLLTPGLARPAIPLRRGERRSWASTLWVETRFAPFAGPWNLARFPAAVVPIGRHSNGLPLGGQLVAAPGGEQLILSAARQLEDLNPWPRHAPLHA